MKQIALQRLKVIALPKETVAETTDSCGVSTITGVAPKIKVGFLAELAAMGYRVTNPEVLDHCSEAALVADYQMFVRTLKAMRGGDVDYVPLFQGFPEKVPDQDEYFIKRVIGFLSQWLGIDTDNLFDKSDFGADPITQFQTKELYEAGVLRQKGRKGDDATTWIDLEIQFLEDAMDSLRQWMNHCLTAKSSIKQALHEDVRTLVRVFSSGIDMGGIKVKENLALVLEVLWNDEGADGNLINCLKTPTDILRMFAALTDSDVSLATPIKFPRLNRNKRRLILSALEKCASLEEDLLRYRGLWLSVGRGLHPGEFAKQFPKTAEAFDKLRNGKIVTFNSRVQAALDANELGEALYLLSGRPGVMARRMHELIRGEKFQSGVSDRVALVLKCFGEVADKIPAKVLFTLRSYFKTINGLDRRAIVNKKGTIKIVPNKSLAMLSHADINAVVVLLEEALLRRLSTLPPLGKCWVDPAMGQYVAPFQQRKGSDGLVSIPRGSKFDLPDTDVLRLFVYWKDANTDLDLSLVQYDEGWNAVGHVAFTNLRETGIVHSGDIQRAPNGAAEFIDVTYIALPKNVRYMAMQVNLFRGTPFKDLERSHCGWMGRDFTTSDRKTFDIKTVQNLLHIAGSGRQALPIVVDVRERKAVYVDLYKGASTATRVQNTLDAVTTIIQEVSRFTETRPTILDLAHLNAMARGGLVRNRLQADTTIGVTGCNYNASDLETILSEFLV